MLAFKDLTVHDNKNNILLVLAWNFYEDIKNNNYELSDSFINIKELESSNQK